MATVTSLQVASSFPLRKQEKGVFSIHGEYTITASLSNGDIVQMVKIPDGVTVLGIEITHPVLTAGVAPTLAVGDGANASRFATSHTADVAGKFVVGTSDFSSRVNGTPYLYDLSDDDPNGYDTIDITIAGTSTAAGTIKLIAYCTAERSP